MALAVLVGLPAFLVATVSRSSKVPRGAIVGAFLLAIAALVGAYSNDTGIKGPAGFLSMPISGIAFGLLTASSPEVRRNWFAVALAIAIVLFISVFTLLPYGRNDCYL